MHCIFHHAIAIDWKGPNKLESFSHLWITLLFVCQRYRRCTWRMRGEFGMSVLMKFLSGHNSFLKLTAWSPGFMIFPLASKVHNLEIVVATKINIIFTSFVKNLSASSWQIEDVCYNFTIRCQMKDFRNKIKIYSWSICAWVQFGSLEWINSIKCIGLVYCSLW